MTRSVYMCGGVKPFIVLVPRWHPCSWLCQILVQWWPKMQYRSGFLSLPPFDGSLPVIFAGGTNLNICDIGGAIYESVNISDKVHCLIKS